MKSGPLPNRKLSTIAILATALTCGAAGPCAQPQSTACATGEVELRDGTCASSADTFELSVPSPEGTPVSTAAHFGASTNDTAAYGSGKGFIFGGGFGFEGPYPDRSTPPVRSLIFSGGTYAEFNAVAIYPATAPTLSLSDGTSLSLADYVVAAGSALTPSGNTVTLIARFTPLGVLDGSFNQGKGYTLGAEAGVAGGGINSILGAAIDSQGRIIVVGEGYDSAASSGNKKAFVMRYLADGSLDTAGFHAVATSGGSGIPAGSAERGFTVSALPRYGTGGGYGGYTPIGTPVRESFSAVAVGPDDSIYAVGYSDRRTAPADASPNTIGLLIKLSSSGILKRVVTGTDTLPFTSGSVAEYFKAVTVDSAGRIIAAGSSNGHGLVARYLSTLSTLDTAFNATGTVGYIYFPGSNELTGAQVDPAGKIVLGGSNSARTLPLMYVLSSNGNSTISASISRYGDVGSTQYFSGVAIQSVGGVAAKYFGIGRNIPAATSKSYSLLTSWNPSTLAADTAFNAAVTPGYQFGPALDSSTSLGTGTTPIEFFTGGAVSNDGLHLIVCGTSRKSDTLTTFPILVRYKISDGTLD